MTATASSNNENASQDTRERILDAAEALIIERGFAATSLRAIADRARVNLAATNYHFGSKMGLLAAVFHRIVEPINAAGGFPTNNARQGQFEGVEKISGETMAKMIEERGGVLGLWRGVE